MLHRLAAFSAVPSSTRACGAVWHHRPPSDSLRGAVVRATVVPRRDARVFRPCSRAPILRAAWTPPERSQRSRTPCAHRLGERTKKQCLGRAMSPRRAARQPPSCHTDVAEPGPWCSCAGLALTRPRTPRAFHGFDDSIHGPNLFARHTNRGTCCGLSTLARPSTLLRGRPPFDPVPGQWRSPPLDVAPRVALRLSSDAAPRCFESASTTDVSRHEHPRRNITSGDCPPSAVGNPPAFDIETAPGRRVSALSSEDRAGPPCGHPASSGSVL